MRSSSTSIVAGLVVLGALAVAGCRSAPVPSDADADAAAPGAAAVAPDPDRETPVPSPPGPPVSIEAMTGGRLPSARIARAVFLGAHDAGASQMAGGRWRLEFPTVHAADVGALGALAAGVGVERRADALTVLTGTGPVVVAFDRAGIEAKRTRVVAAATLAGGHSGLLADGVPADRADRIAELARDLGLGIEIRTGPDGTRRIVVADPVDRATVARWASCPADDCGPGAPSDEDGHQPVDLRSSGAWIAAVTGPLDDATRQVPPSNDGGVSWTNLEAQQYRPEMVAAGSDALVLSASRVPSPSPDRVPYDAAMVIGSPVLGWGRIEVEAVLPSGAGLWPAIWLLPSAACESPGRCAGYGTRDYVEVDLAEAGAGRRGHVHTSMHWFGPDGVAHSRTARTRPGTSPDGWHEFILEWRPAVIGWWIDGRLAMTVPVGADPHGAPAAEPAHRLVMNLAVGGSFAGDAAIDPASGWWPETLVPRGWPDPGWVEASMHVRSVRFVPLT